MKNRIKSSKSFKSECKRDTNILLLDYEITINYHINGDLAD